MLRPASCLLVGIASVYAVAVTSPTGRAAGDRPPQTGTAQAAAPGGAGVDPASSAAVPFGNANGTLRLYSWLELRDRRIFAQFAVVNVGKSPVLLSDVSPTSVSFKPDDPDRYPSLGIGDSMQSAGHVGGPELYRVLRPSTERRLDAHRPEDAVIQEKRLGAVTALEDIKNGTLVFSVKGRVMTIVPGTGDLTKDWYRVETRIRLGDKGVVDAIVPSLKDGKR